MTTRRGRRLAPLPPLLAATVLGATACGAPSVRVADEPPPQSSTAPLVVDGDAGSDNGAGSSGDAPAEVVIEVDEPVGTMVARSTVPKLTAYVEPDDTSEPVATLQDPTAVGGPLVLQVLTPFQMPTPEWVEVSLPVRPNGTTGWIRSSDVSLAVNPYRIEIDTSDFLLELYEADELVLSTTIAVGTGDTPTPYGDFFLAELLQPSSPDGPYGPFAFGLSGFSDVLTSFAGGDGVIGIHGTNDPSVLGTEVSHGCIRVENETIIEMAELVPLGTPVSIQA